MLKSKYIRKSVAILIAVVMLTSTLLATTAVANQPKSAEQIAAETLFELGLFRGTRVDAYDNPVFDLQFPANRMQGMVMLVRLLGVYDEARASTIRCPFDDAGTQYNGAILGFAQNRGLTTGVTPNTFDPTGALTAAMYLTFVLRSLGYVAGEDFTWNAAWELTDSLGITDGKFDAANNSMLRGDVALISLSALVQTYKGSNQTLVEALVEAGAVPENAPERVAAALAAIG